MTTRLVETRTEQPAPLVYRVAEVARLLQISEATVYRRIERGDIPALHFGRSVRVPRWWITEQLGDAA